MAPPNTRTANEKSKKSKVEIFSHSLTGIGGVKKIGVKDIEEVMYYSPKCRGLNKFGGDSNLGNSSQRRLRINTGRR